MKLTEISVLNALYRQMDSRKFQATKRQIIAAYKLMRSEGRAKPLKTRDGIYRLLTGEGTPDIKHHRFLSDTISEKWKYHFGEENFDAEVARIRLELLQAN